MLYKESIGRRIFVIFNYAFCSLLAIVCILPLIHIFAISLSDNIAVNAGEVKLWPVNFTLASYEYILGEVKFFRAMSVSVMRVVLGIAAGMLMTVLAAYPLSKTRRQFAARQFYVWYFMIAMMISGGLIPNYLLIAGLGLLDSVWALVLPVAVNVFNIILLQNYMKSLPEEIMESAFVDGAGHFKVLFRIVLPLCKPVLATLVLFIAVAHWNSWFDGLIYMNRVQNYPLQSYLQTIVVDIDMDLVQNVDDLLLNVTQKSSKSAQIFLAMLPILCVYPFLQKYFTSGIVMGSVKG
ncbi:putative aldouronate transport system permease protein [Anaerotaenia torta]|uniref:carbohydrate ABC transporter permease n=1 Tax=Anaerotaenia torta TaxID=433293 RepID=UPI003D1E1463